MNARALVLSCLVAVLPAAAQIDLSQWSLRSVRTVNWGAVALPTFDSVGVETRVQDGIARSRITLVWTAGGMTTPAYRWRCVAPEPEMTFVSPNSWPDLWSASWPKHDSLVITYTIGADGSKRDSAYYYTPVSTCKVDSILYTTVAMDSLEMSTSFQLPTDAVVSDLSLWVGAEKVPAWIMDRNQASAQYNQIVGVRRDPALLETWGGGSYNLRIFPQRTGETRRLELEVTQAWREGMELPVRFTRPPTQVAYFWDGTQYRYDSLPGEGVRHLALALASGDDAPASLDLGSLGSLEASSGTAHGSWDSPKELVARARRGVREVWAAARDGKGAFGSRVVFRGNEFRVAPEPDERLVVLDALHNPERARRLALLALARYGVDGNRVDLAWRDREGSLRRLWGTPRAFTSENADEAIAALKSWVPADSLDPLELLERLVRTDSGKVVVLVSDVEVPLFGEPDPYSIGGGIVSPSVYDAWVLHSQQYWQARSDAWSRLGKSMHGAGMKLFGWWSDSYASTAASATGGYWFGNSSWLNWGWWSRGDSLVAPRLFGAERRGWDEGFQGMSLRTGGLAVDSLADDLVQNASWGGWTDIIFFRPRIMIQTLDFVVAARSSSPALAARSMGPALPESLVVTLAGRNQVAGTLDLTVDGFWGGLDVQASHRLHVPAASSSEGAKIWAGEYVNKIQPWIWTADSIRKLTLALGRGYRIATPATSFLALEPGVAPYDSLGGQGEAAGATKYAALSADMSILRVQDGTSGGVLLDTMALETILAGRVLAVAPTRAPLQGLKLVAGRGVTMRAGPSLDAPRLQILDLSGRELAAMEMSRDGDGWSASWRPARTTFVVVRMVQDGKVHSARILARP